MSVTLMTPGRSLEQRLEALRKGNVVRSRRAALKRDLTAGRVSAREVLLSPPEWALTMRVEDVLLAMPKVGRVKARRALAASGVSPRKSVGGLSVRQRRELVALLPAARRYVP